MVHAIVGANWGDEGKGKTTDMYAKDCDIVVRFQGGANAGHTIINDRGKIVLHLLPSGVCYDHTVNIIGNGVALDIGCFFAELDQLKSVGYNPKLLISDRAEVLLDWHVDFDTFEEERLAAAAFGSTKSGIAPFYSDKYAKIGIQVCDLFHSDRLRERINRLAEYKSLLLKHLYNKPPVDADKVYEKLISYADRLKPYVCDTFAYLSNAVKQGKNILLEGQLGTLRDPDMGIYPFTTSSHTLAGFGAIGAAGIPPYEIKRITCVVKAYSSAVGAGPFVSEMFGDEAHELRERGGDAGEYGAKTGRPRRVGWMDTVASRYGCRVQGATEAILTIVDALGYLDEIKICTGYEIDGEIIKNFPPNCLLEKAKPVLITMPGWKCDISKIRKYSDLPQACRDYIEFIETELEIPVTMVTNGPKRDEYIYKN